MLDSTERLYYFPALIFSILLHFFFVFYILNNSVIKTEPAKIINVSLDNFFPAQKKQIVSPPQIENEKAPDSQRFLSDKDNTVKQESIRRGDNPKAGLRRKAQKPQEAKPLDLSPVDSGAKAKQKQNPLANAEKNLALALSSAALPGRQGIPDHLPSVKDGEITLLNTKASKYAVFVRRVATQVFNQLKVNAWKSLDYSSIAAIKEFSEVTAILDSKGNLIKVLLSQSSNSNNFNNILEKSVKSHAKDPHPPPSAAGPDGNFTFIFQSKIFSQKRVNPRTNIPFERRWLVLRVGLK